MTPEVVTDAVLTERHNLYVALGALGLFITMVVGHRIVFKGWRGGSEVTLAVRDRLRWLSLPLLILVPLWWAATQLEPLFFLSAELFVTACFVGVILVLESVRTTLSRKFNLSDRVLAAILYAVPTFVFVLSVLQVDVLEGVGGYALGTVLIVFLFLHLIYSYLFKWVPWEHPLSQVLRKRLGPWVYLGIVGVTIYFGMLRYPGLSVGERTLATLAGALVLLGVLVASEALLATIFDFYF